MVNIGQITLIIILMIVLIVTFVIYCVLIKKCTDAFLNKQSQSKIENQQPEIITPILPPPAIMSPPNYPITDPVKMYDYNKLNDPLEEPATRVDRYLLGPIEMRRMFNYPVRGYPDNPRWLGLLISTDDDHSNKIIKLFGRQRYPRSEQYEYYAMINIGLDQIKVHIDRKKELYDDDEVHIPELNKKYKVKLNKDEDSYYNPYF
jgi:hypothetical protein